MLLHGLSCFLPSLLEHPSYLDCCSRGKKTQNRAWFSQHMEQNKCPCEPKAGMQSLVLGTFMLRCLWWCAALTVRMLQLAELSLGHHQHWAQNELVAEHFGCGTGEEKLRDFCKLSCNLHWLLWTLSSPDGTSGSSLVWYAAWWTSASLNCIKALLPLLELIATSGLGDPPEGFLFTFPESLHCSLRKKGLANWPTANKPLKDPVLALAEQSSADCLKQCCAAAKWVTEDSEVDSSL